MKISKKIYSKKNWDIWINDTDALNSNETFDSLHDIISSTIKDQTETKTTRTKLKLKPKSPWITEKSLLLKQSSNKLQKKYIRNKSLITYNELLDTIKEYKKMLDLIKNLITSKDSQRQVQIVEKFGI